MTQTAGRRSAPPEELAALEEERAFSDRSSYRKLQVEGDGARSWLNDLLTAGLSDLEEGRAARSLLISPTGHIRADVHVVATAEGFLLLQDPAQPRGVRAEGGGGGGWDPARHCGSIPPPSRRNR